MVEKAIQELLGGINMKLIKRAKIAAKKSGKKIDPNVLRGLKGIQAMHDLTKKGKGSVYDSYISNK